MIKAVIFDFFGVICSDNYWRLVKQNQHVVSEFHHLSADVNLAQLSWQEFVDTVANRINKDPAKVRKFFESSSIDPRMIAYVDELHKTYKTALLTNAHHEFFDPIAEQAGLTKIFDKIVVSSRAGMVKPDPKIFEFMLKDLGIQAVDAIFIDDNQMNVEAGVSAGIRSILFRDFESSVKEIDKLLADSDN